jgi:uncharacterized protein (DUF885 family)
VQLRDEVKRLQGRRFNPQRFHDAVLAQGLLPPALVRQGVLANLGLKP